LEKKNGALRGAAPDQLAAFSLAVLYVDVASGILQTAILKRAVDEHAVVEDQVLVFEDLPFVSVHGYGHPMVRRLRRRAPL
jgi:hypothetical protein